MGLNYKIIKKECVIYNHNIALKHFVLFPNILNATLVLEMMEEVGHNLSEDYL
jgi:hypothetical protein